MGHRRLVLIAALVVAPSAPATAAPPSVVEDAPACAEPDLDDARLMIGRDLSTAGRQRFDAGDYLGAIAMWEQVMVVMPANSSVQVNLAHAHREAYALDADPDHLDKALTLFRAEFSAAEVGDAQREVLASEIAALEAELEALAAREAKARAERDEQIRGEQLRRDELILAKSEAEHASEVQRLYYGLGGASLGLGVGGLVAMSVFLGLGANASAEGRELASMIGVEPSQYTSLLARGQSFNVGAITAGVLGGALATTGLAVLIAAGRRNERVVKPAQERALQIGWAPVPGGVQLRF